MHFDPVLHGQRGRIGKPADFGDLRVACQIGIAPGVQFDHGRAEPDCRVDLARIGFDEQRHADVRGAQFGHQRGQLIIVSCCVEPAFGRALLALFGDDARGVRAVAQRDRQHLGGRRHFEIERDRQLGAKSGDVVVGDVPPIFAKVRGDAVCARFSRQQSRAHRIGVTRLTRIPHRRDMVDIDPQAKPVALNVSKGHAARLPGLIAGIAANSGGNASAG